MKKPEEGQVRLLSHPRHHPGRRSFLPAQGRWLPDGERLTARKIEGRAAKARLFFSGGAFRVRDFRHSLNGAVGQLLIGLINGSFYALLSLGLAVIFGMLNIINFAHGAQYMLGAVAAYLI